MRERLADLFPATFAGPAGDGRKQATVVHPRPVMPLYAVPRSRRDYSAEIGDGLGSSVIMAPVHYIANNSTQARPMVYEVDGMKLTPRPDHELLRLLKRPNPFYGWKSLLQALLVSYCIPGEGYWIKLRRNRADRPRQLWYLPHWVIAPKWPQTGQVFISHYEYRPGGAARENFDPQDVIHFRHGINPRNVRHGLSPLDSVLREIFTDEEASNFTASLLSNLGVPGLIFSPADEKYLPDEEDIEQSKQRFQERFTGDFRGAALFFGTPTKVEKVGHSPADMNLGGIRDISEERVCAALNIPAAVVGFGTGLHQTKVGATMREMRRMAWTDGIIPKLGGIAETIELDLLPEFEPEPERFVFGFDFSHVEAMQETEKEKTERIGQAVRDSVITVADAQRELGFSVDESQDLYLRGINLLERPAGDADFEPAPVIEGEPGDMED